MITPKRLARIKQVASRRQKDLVLVLEDIHDPHNAEAVFRTCDGFGVQNVYLIFEKEPYFNPRRVGKASSSSANKWLDFHIYRSAAECLGELKKAGYRIFATVPPPHLLGTSCNFVTESNANQVNFFSSDQSQVKRCGGLSPDDQSIFRSNFKNKKVALLLGNEFRGLSEAAVKLSDEKVTIPMRGMVQSLNLSVTAAIFLYEAARQRQRAGKYLVSKKESQKLIESFSKR